MFKRISGERDSLSVLSSGSSEDESSDERHDMKNGWKTAIIGARGISYSSRKVINDVMAICPYVRKESKFESKKEISKIAEICELSNCSHGIYISESRDSTFVTLGDSKLGPTIKYRLESYFGIHDLFFEGNCSKNSRPLLLFSPGFDDKIWKEHKNLLSKCFGAAINHKRIKPFFDRVFYFCLFEDKIVIRHFEFGDDFEIREVGPRILLEPMLVLEGPFGGKVSWKNVKPHMPSAEDVKKVLKSSKRNQKRASNLISRERKLQAVDNEPEYEDILFQQ